MPSIPFSGPRRLEVSAPSDFKKSKCCWFDYFCKIKFNETEIDWYKNTKPYIIIVYKIFKNKEE